MYRLKTENGGFHPDTIRGVEGPEGVSGWKPTLEFFNRLISRLRSIPKHTLVYRMWQTDAGMRIDSVLAPHFMF